MTTQENTATTTVNNAVQAEAPVQAAVPQEQATMNYADACDFKLPEQWNGSVFCIPESTVYKGLHRVGI